MKRYRLSETNTSVLLELSDTYRMSRDQILTEALADFTKKLRKKDKYGAKLADGWPGLSFSFPNLCWDGEPVNLEYTVQRQNPEVLFHDPFFGDTLTLGFQTYGEFVPFFPSFREICSRHDHDAPADEKWSLKEAEKSKLWAALMLAGRLCMERNNG